MLPSAAPSEADEDQARARERIEAAIAVVEAFLRSPPGPSDEAYEIAYGRGLIDAIDTLPLRERRFASQACATVVIGNADLPDRIVIELGAYFGWIDDYHQAQLLGAERTERLREILAARAGLRASGESLADMRTGGYRYDNTIGRAVLFAMLIERGSRWRALVFALLSSTALGVAWFGLLRGELKIYGARPETLRVGKSLVGIGFWIRCFMACSISILVLAHFSHLGTAEGVFTLLYSAAIFAFLARILIDLVDQAMIALTVRVLIPLGRMMHLPETPWTRLCVLGSVGLMLLPVLHVTWLDVPAPAALAVLAIAALALLAGTRRRAASLLMVIVIGALEFGRITGTFEGANPWVTGFAFAAISQAVAELAPEFASRFVSTPPQWLAALGRLYGLPEWACGIAAILGVMFLSPLFVILHVRYESHYFGLAIAALACALAVAYPSQHVLVLLPICIGLGLFVMIQADRGAQAYAHRALARAGR